LTAPGELELACTELGPALDLLRGLGLRLDVIYPADDPHTALFTHGTTRVRLTSRPDAPPLQHSLPPFLPEFVLTKAGRSSGEGRAGMLYRDLIPGRLGGRYIASHITIPDGGPVSDWVHFHKIAFQMIYVRSGWVRVVYEDQGEPFVLEAGDLVLQPPEIRHRVLESSPGLEVIEITCPALHETFADHDMALPTCKLDPAREFSGQRFLRHLASQTPWTPFAGGEAQETRVRNATGGLAQVRTIRSTGGPLAFPAHERELVFGFVLAGSARLEFDGARDLGPADAFAIPPGEPWNLADPSRDFRLLHVTTATPG
jgi:quercetin dioxygenase-like cupin family protein